MRIKSWRKQTLTGSAQPWFGDVLTAAFVPRAASVNGLYTVQVADTTLYEVGDRIILGYGQTGQNALLVDVLTDATHLSVQSEGGAPVKAWVNGTILTLAITCSDIYFQGYDGNTGAIYLGSDNTVTDTGGGSAWKKIQKVAANSILDGFNFGNHGGADSLNTAGWMAGTADDFVLIGAVVN